ncbi:MAG: matrixin family metalloprotease [Verrucomicrobia bacterium]|nr:matrixin family metalloprotease [Verrucomicrobiota bacterium]
MPDNLRKQPFNLPLRRLASDTAPSPDVYALQALLSQYGYLAGDYCPGHYDQATARAVTQFQSFYRLYPAEDGVCDEATINHLNQPRCGVPDPSPAHRAAHGRLSPFVTVGAQWPTVQLTFRFLNSTPDLPQNRQRDIIREAFNRWAQVSALRFTEVAANVASQLTVAFHSGNHGDGSSFDNGGGPSGNTLAHAFFPPPRGGSFAGALHFDEFELWKDQPGGPGTRLYNVTLHEIGHLLGLDHSQDQNAIMYAYYAENRNDLRADDIAGIQSLYGAPTPGPVALAPGQQVSGHLPGTGAEVRYQATLQNKLLVRLSGPPGQDFDLYVRFGAPAGRNAGEFDQVSYGVTADELVTINNPRAGTYHMLVHSYQGAGNYTLEVEVT